MSNELLKLPELPAELRRDWVWHRNHDGSSARLSNAAEGLSTNFQPLATIEACISEALDIAFGEAQLAQAEVEVLPAFRYEDLGSEQRIIVQQATREIKDELEVMRRSGRKIGERLLAIKEQLPHGQFGSWLRAEFDWSQDTANGWMRVAKLAAQNTNYSEFEGKFSRTALIALAKPSTPAAAIEEAGQRAATGEIITAAAAREIVQAHKPAPPAPQLPADWEVWVARAKALPRGKIEVLNAESEAFYYSTAKGGSTGKWADICRAIEADERAQQAQRQVAAPPEVNPAAIITRINELCTQRDTRAAYQEAHKLPVGLLHQAAFDAIDELVEGQPYRPIGQALPTVREVTIRNSTSKKQVGAVAVYGALAVTPAQEDDPQRKIAPWKVTHIHSGYAVGAAPTVQRACKAAARLSAIGDWSFTQPAQLPEALQQALKAEHAALVQDGLFVSRPGAESQKQTASAATPARVAPAEAAAPALPTGAYRAPYGTASSGRCGPIVPHILVVEVRLAHFRLPVLRRLATVYDTATTVRAADEAGKQETVQQHHVYCLPDTASWERLQAAHSKLQRRITLLGDNLKLLGSYANKLERAGGLKNAPNPLSPTVIEASADPDTDGDRMGWYIDTWGVPKVNRKPVVRHSAKMLEHIAGHGMQQQARCFICPGDENWKVIEAAHAEAEAARSELLAVLKELGTYEEALGDHRYRPTAPTPIEAALAVATPIEKLDEDKGGALYAEAERRLSAIYAKLDDADVALLDYLLADKTLWDHLTFTVLLAERTDRAGLAAALAEYEKEPA